MEKNPIILKLNKALPGAILEVRRFGRSEVLSIWVETQLIPKIALFLKSDPDFRLDWLENFSVVEFEKVLVATYFVRSTLHPYHLIIRASAVPESSSQEAYLPSIKYIWPMGEAMEREAEEMFGICFRLEGEPKSPPRTYRLPANWEGFPLRKNYVFPTEVQGISHDRPFKLSGPSASHKKKAES